MCVCRVKLVYTNDTINWFNFTDYDLSLSLYSSHVGGSSSLSSSSGGSGSSSRLTPFANLSAVSTRATIGQSFEGIDSHYLIFLIPLV